MWVCIWSARNERAVRADAERPRKANAGARAGSSGPCGAGRRSAQHAKGNSGDSGRTLLPCPDEEGSAGRVRPPKPALPARVGLGAGARPRHCKEGGRLDVATWADAMTILRLRVGDGDFSLDDAAKEAVEVVQRLAAGDRQAAVSMLPRLPELALQLRKRKHARRAVRGRGDEDVSEASRRAASELAPGGGAGRGVRVRAHRPVAAVAPVHEDPLVVDHDGVRRRLVLVEAVERRVPASRLARHASALAAAWSRTGEWYEPGKPPPWTRRSGHGLEAASGGLCRRPLPHGRAV